MPAAASQSAELSNSDEVDFEKLIKSVHESVPDDSTDLREHLASLAAGIRNQLSPVTMTAIERVTQSISVANELARRIEFAIEILHNNEMAEYLDDAWMANFRDRIRVVTRLLPLVGGFNNLYHHAKVLNSASEARPTLAEVDGEKFENFGYSLSAFALEIGLWTFGAPYQMAWRGTRFVSNRTLLRGVNYLDNRLIALLMSEIHWKIREKVYESISAENIQVTLSKFKELREDARGIELRDEEGNYDELVDLSITATELREYEFVQERGDRGVVGGPVESSDGGFWSDLLDIEFPSIDLESLLAELV